MVRGKTTWRGKENMARRKVIFGYFKLGKPTGEGIKIYPNGQVK
jgi:hypothetical protein